MGTLNHIHNFLRIDDRLATSGMPQPDDFAALRLAGFDVVINLALPTSDNALSNEGELVSVVTRKAASGVRGDCKDSLLTAELIKAAT